MPLTERQVLIRSAIAQEVQSSGAAEIVYCTEWLGYLPYGAYQWIECSQHDFSGDLPPDWDLADLTALAESGFLLRIGDWQDPEDEFHRRVTYRCG